ncbi:MAG: 50S ribosomal protein L19 [Actinobacteria bacterium]|nr:50S ribosomal protein L19 [Actinomycetota bacterium]
MTTIIDKLEKAQIKRVPTFDAGDRVRVHFQVIEGTRRRTQVFEGVVLKRQGSGARETFTVRKQSFGVGVERTFPVHSTKIEKIEVAARGEVRRAKLYYLRDRVGKRARVRERAWTPAEQAKLDAEMAGAYDEQGPQEEAELVEPAAEQAEEAANAEATEAGATEAEATEAPASEEPAAEAAEAEAPAAEATDEPVAEEPAADEPVPEEPVAEEAPVEEAPAEEAQAEEAQAEEAPAEEPAAAEEAPAEGDSETEEPAS